MLKPLCLRERGITEVMGFGCYFDISVAETWLPNHVHVPVRCDI